MQFILILRVFWFRSSKKSLRRWMRRDKFVSDHDDNNSQFG